MENKQPHIQLEQFDGVNRAIIVGDPARVTHIATYLDHVEEGAFNREFKSIVGEYKGQKLLVLSTGIGAPSTAIAIEELAQIGIETIIRVGSAGAMQRDISLGALLIAEGVVRDDGLTKKYVPENYPAVPSSTLLYLAKKHYPQAITGIVRSHDGFYMEDNAEVEAYWSSKGVIGADMESGALLTIGRLRSLQTLSILNNVVGYQEDLSEGVNSLVNQESLIMSGEKESILLALTILSDKELTEA